MAIGRITPLTYPVSLREFRDITNVSVEGRPSDALLAAHGFFWADDVTQPTPSAPYKVITGPTVALVNGAYVEQYAERDMTVDELRGAIEAWKGQRLLNGAPFGDKTYAVDALSLATINGMLHAASLAIQGIMNWAPPFNQRIADDNTVTVFDLPADAITFAAAVGAWFGSVVLYARTLKDRALAGEKFDFTTGWP